MNQRKMLGAAAAVAMGTGIAFAGLAPAEASLGQCASTNFCMWNDGGYVGYLNGWPGDRPSYNSTNNNAATSLYNHGVSCDIRFWENQDYAGNYGDLNQGSSYENLASWWIVWPTYNFDNRISSHEWRC